MVTAAHGKDSCGRSAWKTVSYGRDFTLEQGKKRPPPEEEGVAEATCDEQTATPIPNPPVSLGEEV